MCKLDCEHPDFNKPSEEQLAELQESSRGLVLKKEFVFTSTVGKKPNRTIEPQGVHIVGRTPLPNGERRIVVVGKPRPSNENITIKVKRGDI